jgi:MFS family permease
MLAAEVYMYLICLCEVIFLTFFRETFKVRILAKRAAKLRMETGNDNYRTTFELHDIDNNATLLEAIMRPVVVLWSNGVLLAISIFGSVTFTFFYVMSTTLPDILEGVYGLSPAQTGAAFISFSAGSIVTVTLCNQTLDRIYIRLRDTKGKGIGQPEYRLPLSIVGGLLLPAVVVFYGWVAEAQLPLWVFLISVALMGAAMMLGSLPLMAYVVDAFGIYSASAMTAVIVTRCLMGTFLPLATAPLVREFGFGWGFTILGALSLSLAPLPAYILRYGKSWRQKSPYTREVDE